MQQFFYFITILLCGSSMLSAQMLGVDQFSVGFNRPVDITHAGDDRLFVVDQPGRIWIVRPDGSKVNQPFLDIRSRVNNSGNERGLLGLAFSPNYSSDGHFYVNYTGVDGQTTISRFSVEANHPNIADPTSEQVVLTIPQPFANHNAGDLAFGLDSYLYIPTGDGGSGGDPGNRSQNPQLLLGKMLRLDVLNQDTFRIPEDNPFVGNDEVRDEIWAIGLRNPWRISFDRLTGDLWIGDVGQSAFEEIDFQPASSLGGENYGWKCYEGDEPFVLSGNCPPQSALTFPVSVHPHSGTNECSITGGFVYRGSEFPALQGLYIYGDYCSGKIWTLRPDGQGGFNRQEAMSYSSFQLTSFGENAAGELFLTAHGEGTIYKLVDLCVGFSALSSANNEDCPGAENGSVFLSISGGTTPYVVSPSMISGLAPGDYTFTIQDDAGCTITIQETIEASPYQVPEIAFSMDSSSLVVTNDTFDNYQWLFDGNLIPGATGASFMPDATGTYQVFSQLANCDLKSVGVDWIVNKLPQLIDLTYWKMYPNPTRGDTQLDLRFDRAVPTTVWVRDNIGRELIRLDLDSRSVYHIDLPVGKWMPGLYLVSVQRADGISTRRLIVQP